VTFGRSRSSEVIDFGANRKCVCDFLLDLVRHSNLGPILHCFGDIAGFVVLLSPLLFPLILGCSRCTRSPMFGSMWARSLSYSAVELFSKHPILCEKHASTSQTDGQTTYCRITALCVASRGKNLKQRRQKLREKVWKCVLADRNTTPHDRLLASWRCLSVCPSVRPSITLCIVAFRVGVEG